MVISLPAPTGLLKNVIPPCRVVWLFVIFFILQDSAMALPRYIVRADFSNVRAEVLVNDIPVAMLGPGDSSPFVVPVNQFVVKGRNSLGVILHAGPDIGTADQPWPNGVGAPGYTGPATATIRIGYYAENETALGTDKPALVSLHWEGMATPRPQRLERAFDAAIEAAPFAWQSATPIAVVDAATRVQALDYLGRLHALLAHAQFDEFIGEQSVKLEEIAKVAYGVPADYMRAPMLQALRAHSAPPYALEPFNRDDIDLRLIANGRMIECLKRGRRPLFEFRRPGSDETLSLPVMLGRIDGRWQVLR